MKAEEIKIKKRSYFGRVLRTPQTFKGHYRISRKSGNSNRNAIVAAFRLTLVLFYTNRFRKLKRETQ